MSTPASPPQPPMMPAPVRPSNGTAVAAVIVGPIALVNALLVPLPLIGILAFFVAFPFVVGALVLGHLGLVSAKGSEVGRAPAMIGLITGYVAAAIIVVTIGRFAFSFIAFPLFGGF